MKTKNNIHLSHNARYGYAVYFPSLKGFLGKRNKLVRCLYKAVLYRTIDDARFSNLLCYVAGACRIVEVSI